ncbi:MAG: type II toxin-antitoxin system RelE/ParE family toxin [Albidovulum sp.]|uniref:type II toxin-antitoxin system RelE/ParE family toxin n=1 Tax=Albidovulum sp. TaxID=1872424 RepID=UPI003CB76830
MAKGRYRLTPAAEDDLAAIWRFTAERWSDDQADRYLDALVMTFETIADFPAIARERSEFTPPIRIHPSGAHLVIYLDGQGGGTVLRVLHNRQDLLHALDG